MKRIFACLLAVVMLVAMTCTASAEETVTVSVGNVRGEVGELVEVPVSVSEGHYLVNGRIFLTYDPTVLELQEVCDDPDNPYFENVNTAILDSSFMWMFASPKAGKANFVFATSSSAGNATGGAIYTLTFKLLKEADASAIVVTVPEMRTNNGGEDTDAALTLVNADVEVLKFDPTPDLKGDVNGNGDVTLPDAVRLFYYANGEPGLELTEKQLRNADVTGDGVVNLADAVRLFYYVSGSIVKL